MTVNRELTHREVERLVHGGAHDKRRLLDYWNKIYGDLPADLRHRRPCLLGPPEAFPDESAPASYFKLWPDHDPRAFGPRSEAVVRRLASSCAGWPLRPTSEEFYRAVHAARPDLRQRCLISTWAVEASRLDIFDAWGERVYTIRQLVAAFHRVEGLHTFTTFRFINNMAMIPEFDGIPLWNC